MDVCVIGAGISGLVTAKETIENGFQPYLFEAEYDVGGVFNTASTSGRVYDHCHLTVSSRFMDMSSMPVLVQKHLHHSEYLNYIRHFAETFNLKSRITFGTKVVSVRRLAPRQWEVITQHRETGKQTTRTFCAVAVCCGTHQTPRQLTEEQVPGLSTFTGQIVHTANYKNAEFLRGKRIVSMGCGESGADIITECSEVASEMLMSIRSYPYIMPRQFDRAHVASTDSHPVPLAIMSGLHPIPFLLRPVKAALNIFGGFVCLSALAVRKLFGCVCWPVLRSGASKLDSFGYPVSAGKPLMDRNVEATKEGYELMHTWAMLGKCHERNKFCTKNASFVPAITSGKLPVNASGIARVEGSTIFFNNGRKFENCDVLLTCIGYIDAFEFLKDPELVPKQPFGVRSLFCHAFQPDPALVDIAFIGWVRPSIGGIPICSEMNARYWALLLSGKRQLPQDVRTMAAEQAKQEDEQFKLSGSIKTVVQLMPFLTKMSKLIGCEPKLTTILRYGGISSLMAILTSNPIPHIYRFDGPGATPALAAQNVKKSVGSIGLLHGAMYAFQNAMADLGLKRLYTYTFHGPAIGEASQSYLFKTCGMSTLNAPSPKWICDA